MAMSPAQRHMARALAHSGVLAAAAAPLRRRAETGEGASAYLLERARLGVDLRRLKEIQSIEKKIELKRELLPAYDPWIEGVLQADAEGIDGVQDDIVIQIMIWRIDVGDFGAAMPLVEYVLRWGLTLPERFNRTPATLIVEEIAEAALKALGQDQDFDLHLLRTIAEIGLGHDMHDQVRAKLMKALGLQMARHAETIALDADGVAGGRRAAIEQALKYLRRALALNSSAGVKKDIQRLEREANKLAAQPPEGKTE